MNVLIKSIDEAIQEHVDALTLGWSSILFVPNIQLLENITKNLLKVFKERNLSVQRRQNSFYLNNEYIRVLIADYNGASCEHVYLVTILNHDQIKPEILDEIKCIPANIKNIYPKLYFAYEHKMHCECGAGA